MTPNGPKNDTFDAKWAEKRDFRRQTINKNERNFVQNYQRDALSWFLMVVRRETFNLYKFLTKIENLKIVKETFIIIIDN